MSPKKIWATIALTLCISSKLLADTTLEEIQGEGIWPKFVVKRTIAASPEIVAAIFWDCESAPQYMPNCLSVKKVYDQGATIIAIYTLGMPFFLPDEVYQSTNKLSKTNKGYKISWSVPKSVYSLGAVGSISIEAEGNGSQITYENLATPTSNFAKILKSKAGCEIVNAVNALNTRVLQEIQGNPALLKKQTEALHKSLP